MSYLVNPGEAAEAAAWVDIVPSAEGTRVTRGFEHDYGYNLVGRYFGLIWSGMVRRDYRLSLDRLQALLDRLPRVDYGSLEFDESYLEAGNIAYIVTTGPRDSVADPASLEQALAEVRDFLDGAGLEPNGFAIAILRGAVGAGRRLDVAIPFAGTPPADTASSTVLLGRSYEGYVIRATHPGDLQALGATHDRLVAYLAATGRRPNGDPWQRYVTAAGPDGPRVEICYPVLAD